MHAAKGWLQTWNDGNKIRMTKRNTKTQKWSRKFGEVSHRNTRFDEQTLQSGKPLCTIWNQSSVT